MSQILPYAILSPAYMEYDPATPAVAQQEANVKLAHVTYARSRAASSSGSGYVAPLELDQNRSMEDQAQANLEHAKADLEQKQLDYVRAKSLFDAALISESWKNIAGSGGIGAREQQSARGHESMLQR